MNFNDLTPEQIGKAKTCKTSEDFAALAKAEGLELSDNELETVAGGGEHETTDGFGFDSIVGSCRLG